MELKRKYLTTQEMFNIVESIKNESPLNREIIKIGMVAQFLISEEELGKHDNCDEIYDIIMASDIDFETEVINYYRLEKCIDEEVSIENSIKKLVDEVVKKMPKNFDVDKTIKSLKDVMKNDGRINKRANTSKLYDNKGAKSGN